MKKSIETISFLSILFAWSISVIATGLYQIWTVGKTDDFGVVVFWSGLFELLAWLIFIRPVLTRMNHDRWYFAPYLFPFLTLLYAELVFFILIGWLFLKSEFYVVFFAAGVVGLTFGLIYSQLIRSERLKRLFESHEIWRYSVFLYPIIFSFVFFWLFPRVFPATAYRIMPDQIQHQIIARTVPKFKVGDDFEKLANSLPGYLDHIEDGSGNMYSSMENFAFILQVNCNKITRLEYGSSQFDFDNTVYATAPNEKCP